MASAVLHPHQWSVIDKTIGRCWRNQQVAVRIQLSYRTMREPLRAVVNDDIEQGQWLLNRHYL